ncbi:hypothetical protein ACFC00_06385 [Streptomyces adustus]|uniref:hypothetical protein n=1 Tax=Streptomyces adustus TaxID=1609272 RepID=UPI0035D6B09D
MHDPRQARRTRLRIWLHRAWGSCAFVLGAGLLVAATVEVGEIPGSLAEERSYLTAEACTPAAALDARADCLRSIRASVRSTVIIDEGKRQQFTVRLAGPSPVPKEVDLYGSGPLLKRLRPGDQVRVTMWRDYATAISRGDVTQESGDTPVSAPEIITAVVLALVSLGLFAMYAGGRAVLRARRLAVEGLPDTLVPLSKGALAAAACAIPAALLGACWGGLLVVVSAWAAMLPGVWWLTRLLQRRARRRTRHRHRSRAVTPEVVDRTA